MLQPCPGTVPGHGPRGSGAGRRRGAAHFARLRRSWPTLPRRLADRALSRGHLGDEMVRVLVERREEILQRRRTGEWTAASVDVRLELVAELVDVARDRHRRRVAERAEALAEDAVAHREEQVELRLVGPAVLDLVQQLHHPARALSARRALAAGLVHVEL